MVRCACSARVGTPHGAAAWWWPRKQSTSHTAQEMTMTAPTKAPSTQNNGATSEASWENRYRDRWSWDKVLWASHCIDCYPGNCPMRVYLKDGQIVREESAAVFPPIPEG